MQQPSRKLATLPFIQGTNTEPARHLMDATLHRSAQQAPGVALQHNAAVSEAPWRCTHHAAQLVAQKAASQKPAWAQRKPGRKVGPRACAPPPCGCSRLLMPAPMPVWCCPLDGAVLGSVAAVPVPVPVMAAAVLCLCRTTLRVSNPTQPALKHMPFRQHSHRSAQDSSGRHHWPAESATEARSGQQRLAELGPHRSSCTPGQCSCAQPGGR